METNRYPLESIFGRILSPFEQFLIWTTASGVLLMTTTAIAMALGTVGSRSGCLE